MSETSDAPFAPVATLDDLNSLNDDDILDGYRSWNRGDPEPGANRGRAYWHGWCNAARDHHDLPVTPASMQLAHAYLAAQRLGRATEEQPT